MKKEKSARREVRNLIAMLGSSVVVAFIVVIGLVYYFGSSGTYLLRNVLVSPEALERISFETNTGRQQRFVFNKIEFTLADASGKGWGRYAVSKRAYADFYDDVEDLRSLPQLTDEIIAQFRTIAPSTLVIFVQAKDNMGSGKDGVMFQRIEFIDQGDIFRLQLRHEQYEEGAQKEEWVYFRAPGIYQRVVNLFAPTSSKAQVS